MPFLIITRFLFSLLSLAILAGAGYLLWQWYDGDLVRLTNGDLVQTRTDWYLWVGLALLAFSFLGRPVIGPLLAKKDTDPSLPERNDGIEITGNSGATLYVERIGPLNAPVIVLTHGWAMDSTIWYYAKRDLSKNFHVIAWDLPGMGKSKPATPSTIGLSEFASDLRSVMDLAGDRKVVLSGKVSPKYKGKAIIFKKQGKKWKKWKTLRTNKKSKFSSPLPAPRNGKYFWKVELPSCSAFAKSQTGTFSTYSY